MAVREKHHVRRDDTVMVIAGKERGKTGKVLKVLGKKDRAVVEKINMIKRHVRPGPYSRQGGIVEKEGPVHLSNLMVICSKCTDPTRVGRKTLEDGKRVRYCKKCGEIIE